MRRPIRPALSLLLPLALLTMAVAGPAGAWGPLGHRLVAGLAWHELTPQTRTTIKALLAGEEDPTLPGIANWADELREHDPDLGRRSARWHYVNIAEHDCRYDRARACRDGDCVVEAIDAQTRILADDRRPRAERLQALKFVVHFIGDVHQPLHAGYAHDKGGNTVQVSLDGRGSNLHALWDSGLLNQARRDESTWLRHLRAMPSADPMPRDALPPAADAWAEASCAIVKQPGFYPARPVIGKDYLRTWQPTAEAQLRRAGARLAATLNAALDG